MSAYTYITLDDPLATNGTFAQAVNNQGQIVGYYYDSSGAHGFLYSGGTWTPLNDPSATSGTFAEGLMADEFAVLGVVAAIALLTVLAVLVT